MYTAALQIDHVLTSVLLALAELDIASLESARLVCRQWHSTTESDIFWNRVLQRRWNSDVGTIEPARDCSTLPPRPCPFCPSDYCNESHECIYRDLFQSTLPQATSTGIFLPNGPPPSSGPSPNPRSWIRAVFRLKKSIERLQLAERNFTGYGSEAEVCDVLPFIIPVDSDLDDDDQVRVLIEKSLPFRWGEEDQDNELEYTPNIAHGEASWRKFWSDETNDDIRGEQGLRRCFPNPVSFLCSFTFECSYACVFVDTSLKGYIYGFIQGVVLGI